MKHQYLLIVLIQCLIMYCKSTSAEDSFIFNPNFGVGYYEFNSIKPDKYGIKSIKPVLEQYYNLSERSEIKIYSYNEIEQGRYAVYAYINDEDDVMNRITPSNIASLKEAAYITDKQKNNFLVVIDMTTNTVTRIFREKGLLKNLQSAFSDSIEVYGCLQGYPTTVADINGDNIKDLLFIGGGGKIFPQDKIDAHTEVTIFLGPDFTHELLSIELHREDFNFYFDQSGKNYQIVRDQIGQRLKDIKSFTRGTPENLRPGYRIFSKLYFGDFNKDKIYSIFVWRRYYISREKSDPIKGFAFEKEEFELYDIHGTTAEAVFMDGTKGHTYLTDNQLNWQNGFPSQSECHSNKEDNIPLIMKYDRQELSVSDPLIAD